MPSFKKAVLRNFPKFTGTHLCRSFFFNKFAGLRQGWVQKRTLGKKWVKWKLICKYYVTDSPRSSRMDQVKFLENSL